LVSSDLRDPTNTTFLVPEVNELLNEGINEVSRVYPLEVMETVNIQTGIADYPVDFEEVFRVEWFREGTYQATIPSNQSDDSAQGGFDLFAGSLHIPWARIPYFDELTDSLRLWGYQSRTQLDAEGEIFEGDADAEFGVRTYAVLTGYQRLLNSRALYQQWTMDSVNTDMGPRWIMEAANSYERQWQRIRQQLRLMRRR
jgi:hypothetical protein